MGILNARQRIIDMILTLEGKKQLAEGGLRANFYSFSDSGMVYSEDTLVSGGLDFSDRLSFEATGVPQDQIAFKSDDSGRLQAFTPLEGEEYFITHGQIFSGSKEGQRVAITGSQFINLAGTLLSNSLDAFNNQRILKSPDPLDNKERQFLVEPAYLEYMITKDRPFKQEEISEAKIGHIESLFQDKRLSHIPNFKFLPPINKAPGAVSDEKVLLGSYVDIKQKGIETYEELYEQLEPRIKMGFNRTINFTETSQESNVLCQFFEVSNDAIVKLDVIDFGLFPSNDGSPAKHVFFVGKIFVDDHGIHTFANMFVLTFI